jgi:hypothetical protein
MSEGYREDLQITRNGLRTSLSKNRFPGTLLTTLAICMEQKDDSNPTIINAKVVGMMPASW